MVATLFIQAARSDLDLSNQALILSPPRSELPLQHFLPRSYPPTCGSSDCLLLPLGLPLEASATRAQLYTY